MENDKPNNDERNFKERSKKAREKRRKKNKILTFIFIVFFILIISVSFIGYNYFKMYRDGGIDVSKNFKQNEEVYFQIPEGVGLKSISSNLKQSGVIENELFFRIKCQELAIDKNFKAGEFTLNKNMDFYQVVEILQESSSINDDNQVKFLIKEGETQEDIARNLEAQGIISYNEFMQACNTLTFDYEFLKEMPISDERESRLEGYLYPDTYFIKKGESAENIINKFLVRFDQLYTEELRQTTKSKGMTIDEVITIASIIEKEIKYAPERPVAASVIFNRLKQGMPLQMDATVIYAKKQHSDRTTIEDTKIKSPYNTYYVEGLPIGPISNPRIECIEAVLYPENTDYIYYVVKDDTTGEHFYTSDYNEFLKAKQEYLKKFD